jgi:hypothetical protein
VNINLNSHLQVEEQELDNADKLAACLDQIDDACLALKQRMYDELLVTAEQRTQWWARFIDYCRTGK